MSDTSYWTDRETLSTEVSHGDHTETIEVKDITKAELEKVERHERVAMRAARGTADADEIDALPDFEWEDEDADVDYIESLVDEKLVSPAVDPNDIPTQKLRVLVEGMLEAWGADTDVQAATEEMPVEGNR